MITFIILYLISNYVIRITYLYFLLYCHFFKIANYIISYLYLLADGNCRPQTGQPASQPQAGSPLDSSIGNNNNNNINNNNSAISRRGWRGEWRRTDPGTVYSSIWKSSDQPLGKFVQTKYVEH